MTARPRADAPSSLYECPVCGELPRGCRCLRRSVRDRIADAIHFSSQAHASALPFLTLEREPSLEPPDTGGFAVA